MDFGYQNAPLYSLISDNKFTVQQPSSSLTPFCYSNGSLDYFSSSGMLPAMELIQYDPDLLIPSHQPSFDQTVDEVSLQFDPLYSSLNIVEHQNDLFFSDDDLQVSTRTIIESNNSVGNDEFGPLLIWSDSFATNGLDTGAALCHQIQQPAQLSATKQCELEPLEKNDGEKNDSGQGESRVRRSRKRPAKQICGYDCSGGSNNSVADALTWETLSQYFYMPIAQAAKELNIGLTLFKKRCRELGVRRWPHRKLMSIKSLIKNVQEMEKDGSVDPALSKGTLQNAIQTLENQRKMMELMPDIQLEAQTKRLRQACFKANYKKRRLMIMNGGGELANSSGSASSCNDNETATASSANNDLGAPVFEDTDELRSLLCDSLSPADCSFLSDFI